MTKSKLIALNLLQVSKINARVVVSKVIKTVSSVPYVMLSIIYF